MSLTPMAALDARRRHDGASPLVTYYDVPHAERVELSATTFANWVDKTVNLLVSMDIDDNPRVVNTLLLNAPLHWVTLIWTMAVWQAGGCVVARDWSTLGDARNLDAGVIGPRNPHPIPGVETIACSLHPLGAGFTHRPSGVTDYVEALSQPDVHWTLPPVDDVCFEARHAHRWAEIDVEPSAERRIITPSGDPWLDVLHSLVAPLLGGGGSVCVVGASPTRLHEIAHQERAVTR